MNNNLSNAAVVPNERSKDTMTGIKDCKDMHIDIDENTAWFNALVEDDVRFVQDLLQCEDT